MATTITTTATTTNTTAKAAVLVVKDWRGADIIVHPAPHHLDDALCVAQMAFLQEGPVRVFRTRDRAVLEEAVESATHVVADVGLVYDEGRKAFDHHQPDCPERGNDGGKYAAAGLMWRAYGPAIVGYLAPDLGPSGVQEVVERVDSGLIAPSDRIDNGAWAPDCQVSDLALALNAPAEAGAEAGDAAFKEAVKLAALALKASIMEAAAFVKTREIIELRLNEWGVRPPRVVVFDTTLPSPAWQEVLTTSEFPAEVVKFVVWENQAANQWEVRGVPPRPWDRRNILRPEISFPPDWRGLGGQKLAEASGVADAKFCHPGGFFAATESKEGAMQLAKRLLPARKRWDSRPLVDANILQEMEEALKWRHGW